MKKIGMLSTFLGYLESYSLCAIARMQLRMLKQNGYECRFIFRGGDDTEWRKFTSDIKLIPDYIVDNDGDYSGMEERSGKKFEQLVHETYQALREHLADVDVIITHDLIYQSSNSIQDAAAALYASEHPEKLWLHWVHSATSPRDLNKTKRNQYPNSFVVYPNRYDVPRVADNFGYGESQVKVVPHPMDYVEFFDMHPITERLINEKGLLSADVLGCYPLRLDRGKQPEMAIRLFNAFKNEYDRSIRLIIADFQSTGGDKAKFRQELKQLALRMGFSSNDLTFMSEFLADANGNVALETPKKVIRDLFQLSSVYLHPSKSETYSLTTQEARACKNVLILNWDFPAMASIYGDGPIYRKFSSCVDIMTGQNGSTDTKYLPNIDAWMKHLAGEVLYQLDMQSALAMAADTRKTKNLQAVFKRHIEPLFYAVQKDVY